MHIREIPYLFEYPVVVPQSQLAYWPVPKNACTSLKYAFYKLRTGEDFVPFRFKNKYLYHVHTLFPAKKFQPIKLTGWLKLAVVRDPVERMVSAYCNRILYHNDLGKHKQALRRIGLETCPDFPMFINHLQQYREVSKIIKDHTDPQVYFLGKDATYFDLVISIKNLIDLPDKLGLPELELPRKQDGGGEFKHQILATIDDALRAKIFDFHYKDYDVFGQFF